MLWMVCILRIFCWDFDTCTLFDNCLQNYSKTIPLSQFQAIPHPFLPFHSFSDNQSSNWDQTFKQALSAKVKNPHYNKSEGKSKVSPNNSVHIIEVVNVADDPASDGSNEILETEKISFENEESSNIECSSENDETLYTEMVDMCNEIEIVNEDDSDVSQIFGKCLNHLLTCCFFCL